jgi:hypothetical protein
MPWLQLSTSRHSPHIPLLLASFPIDIEELRKVAGAHRPDWERGLESNYHLDQSASAAWLDVVTGNLVLVEAIGAEDREGIVLARLLVQAGGQVVDLLPDRPNRYAENGLYGRRLPIRAVAVREALTHVSAIDALGIPGLVEDPSSGEAVA